MAKRIIKLVSAVGDRINNDPDVGDLLKVQPFPAFQMALVQFMPSHNFMQGSRLHSLLAVPACAMPLCNRLSEY